MMSPDEEERPVAEACAGESEPVDPGQPAGIDASWADHLIYMEAGGEPATWAAEPEDSAPSRRQGLVVVGALALAALAVEWGAAQGFAGRTLDAAMIAMLLGIAIGNCGIDPRAWRAGTRWTLATLLPLGIVLLGARLDLRDLVAVGAQGAVLAAFVIALSGATLYGIHRFVGLPGRLATLLACGNGICGGSAIVAVAPAIGAREDEVAVSVATVALLGLVGMLALPAIATATGMDPATFGIWAGLVIQQTPQVIAAGFTLGPEAGETATVVKLVRIALLAPVVFVVAAFARRRGLENARTPAGLRALVPNFAVGLVVVAGVASLGLLPAFEASLPADSILGARQLSFGLDELAIAGSKGCLLLAMAAVGLETRWDALRATGPQAFSAAAVGAFILTAATALVLRVA